MDDEEIYVMELSRKEYLLGMLSEEPEDAFLNYALGLEYYKEQNYQEAMRYFGLALEKDPQYIAAYYQLGQIFTELDIVDVARRYLEEGLKIATDKKDHRSAGEFREMLENIA